MGAVSPFVSYSDVTGVITCVPTCLGQGPERVVATDEMWLNVPAGNGRRHHPEGVFLTSLPL